MIYLLDTHSIIWFSESNRQLSKKSNTIISDSKNICYVSIASIWEMSIKLKLNKLNLVGTINEFVSELLKRDFNLLNIKLENVIQAGNFDLFYNDPFDRLLISQSRIENIPIISKDIVFDKYGIERIC